MESCRKKQPLSRFCLWPDAQGTGCVCPVPPPCHLGPLCRGGRAGAFPHCPPGLAGLSRPGFLSGPLGLHFTGTSPHGSGPRPQTTLAPCLPWVSSVYPLVQWTDGSECRRGPFPLRCWTARRHAPRPGISCFPVAFRQRGHAGASTVLTSYYFCRRRNAIVKNRNNEGKQKLLTLSHKDTRAPSVLSGLR